MMKEHSPLLVRRGGRDIKKILRSHLIWSGRGGGSHRTVFVSHHPVCAAAVASRHFLTGAASPAHEEGIMPHSNCRTTHCHGRSSSAASQDGLQIRPAG